MGEGVPPSVDKYTCPTQIILCADYVREVVMEPVEQPEAGGERPSLGERSRESHWPDDWDGQQRVETVATTLREPRTAGWVADRADVSVPTARKYLDRLVEYGTLERHAGDAAQRAATYAPYPQARMLDRVRDLAQRPGETLTERKESLLADIDAWRDEFDIDSPTALRASIDASLDADKRRRRRQVAYEWESREYQCSLLDVALQFRDHLDHHGGEHGQSSADDDVVLHQPGSS